MLPLYRKQFPSSKADLAQALDEVLHRFASKEGQIVDLRARVFPYIDEIAVNLDGAQFDSPPPALPKLNPNTTPAFEAAATTISARQISVRGVPVNMRIEAQDLVFHKGQDENGDAVLVIHQLRDGTLSISVSQLDLENAIEKIALQEGRGLTIDHVRLSMRARGQRSLAIDVQVQARKLFMRTRIDISGQIDIDENFVITAPNLKCKSDGGIGSIACSVLDPIFRELEQKSFSLASLPLGDLKVHDVRLTVADTVEITADFGSAA
jgi:hypothetical protein